MNRLKPVLIFLFFCLNSKFSVADESTLIYLGQSNPGEKTQMIGVANALGIPFRFRKPEAAARNPNPLSHPGFLKIAQNPPKIVLLKAGGTSELEALALRKFGSFVVKFSGSKIDPTPYDLFVTLNEHKTGGENVFVTLTVPNKINQKMIESLRPETLKSLVDLPPPYTVALIGGISPFDQFSFSPENFALLKNSLVSVQEKEPGSILVLGSYRTPPEFIVDLEKSLHPNRSRVVGWMSWKNRNLENPFMGYLSVASKIITTGDSISMPSEALETGTPLYVFKPDMGSPKARVFHSNLISMGLAKPLPSNGVLEVYSYDRPPNVADQIANKIKSGLSFIPSIDATEVCKILVEGSRHGKSDGSHF